MLVWPDCYSWLSFYNCAHSRMMKYQTSSKEIKYILSFLQISKLKITKWMVKKLVLYFIVLTVFTDTFVIWCYAIKDNRNMFQLTLFQQRFLIHHCDIIKWGIIEIVLSKIIMTSATCWAGLLAFLEHLRSSQEFMRDRVAQI